MTNCVLDDLSQRYVTKPSQSIDDINNMIHGTHNLIVYDAADFHSNENYFTKSIYPREEHVVQFVQLSVIFSNLSTRDSLSVSVH